MKKLNIIAAALASTVALATPVFAEWTEVGENVSGTTFYIDYGTVKENNGYVYYWRLSNYLKPEPNLSDKVLQEVDCDIPRKYRPLSGIFYKQPMGGGNGDAVKNPSDEWEYPSPNSVADTMTNAVCDFVGK